MNRQAFRNRMQQLKSYREQNPGKTYLDWKKYEEGGEIGDDDRAKIEKALGPRKETLPPYEPLKNVAGGPLATGQIKPLFDLVDAANMTPLGDVLSLKDMYDSGKEKDWLGVGLSALTMVPFVPVTVKEFRKKYKGVTPKASIPKVNKNATQDAINRFTLEQDRRAAKLAEEKALLTEANNQGYKIVERLQDDPSYLQRAAEVKEKFGDDYSTVYADLIDMYNRSPEHFPKTTTFDGGGRARARMEADPGAIKRHLAGGDFPKLNEWNYRIDPTYANLKNNVTEHEWNHYVDFNKTKSPTGDGGSNMFYQMSKDMDGVKVDINDSYYSLPTEQKAYMNQLREYMFQKGMINSRGQKVDTGTITKALNSIEGNGMSSVIRASKQFKNPKTYTRWFNQIPLLSIPALGMYNYFNQRNDNQYERNISNIPNTEL